MEHIYKSFEELPAMVNADQLSNALGISRAGAYQLMHAENFPTVRIGRRMLVPKEHLCAWVENQIQSNNKGKRERL